ncbi:unnamed protein product [Penicillium salamii]|uniref:Uncharacterized protein n=1 Tax=Penicillium salamii TaxID=1612424 RepID=A0A9W4NUL0_9EURO|nr:unnamed protein product [Penicillium salamii]CAG8264106.1 unnamed protein product [Penicillium salamii]CAG8337808.1 unnamed protein product [Penicillium salamii]CAG8341748.1 unnamed protein product [Penicillium salamii]CAG8342063.1 unnamed protein product [Penicillium salamii]
MTKSSQRYIIGGNRGLLNPGPDDLAKLEKVQSSMSSNSRKDKFRRHCRRFWCIYFIANIIFLAIFLPVFFLVVIPAVAQLVVNKSDLWIVNAEVLNPTPTTVEMTLAAKVNLKLALGVRLDPVIFYAFVRSYGHENSYLQIDIPGQTIKGNYTLGVANQHTPLLNLTTWETFVHQTVFQKETALSLYGVTNGYLGVLKSHIVLNKDVMIPSLNKFEGFFIADSTLMLPAEDDGTNLIANITLPNPTVLTFQVGTITLDLKSGDTDLVIVTRKIVSNGTLIPYYTNVLGSLPLVANVGIGDVLKNTLKYLGTESNLNLTGALSGLIDNDKRRRGPALLDGPRRNSGVFDHDAFVQVTHLKKNSLVQRVFEDEDPDKRDSLIDSLARYYALL